MEKRAGDVSKQPFYQKKKFKDGVFIWALVILPLLNFLVFWVYVNIDTVLMTAQRFNIMKGGYEWIGFERYKEVFREYIFGMDGARAHFNIFLNSLRAIVINAIILPLAYISAFAFFKKIKWQKYFRICFYLPSIISVSMLTLSFRYMFHADFGPLRILFAKMGFAPDWLGPESDVLWTLIYIFGIWAGLGMNVIMMNGAMLRIPEDISEYGRLDGVGFWREAFQIVLPLVMPTVSVYIMSVFVSVFSFSLHPMLIATNKGANNKFYTIGWMVLDSVSIGSENDMLLASTVGIAFTLVMTPVILAVRFITSKLTPDVEF